MPCSAIDPSTCCADRRGRRSHRASAAAVLASVLFYAITPAGGDVSPLPTAGSVRAVDLREALERPDGPRVERESLDVQALRRFYRRRGFAPAWGVDGAGMERAARLVEALANASAHGLDPRDYHLDVIRNRRTDAHDDAGIERELLLTDAYLRYAAHVRVGRVRPEQAGQDWGIATSRFDAAGSLTVALQEPLSFPALLRSLPPPADGYARLVNALARYRALAARTGGWPVVPPGPLLRPGGNDARIPRLQRRLATEDDLTTPSSRDDYDAALEGAVRRFQARHGLEIDGIVGPKTLRALTVPVSDRIRQIELNLERWRWLPRDLGRRYIMVNAADATLEVVEDGRMVLASRVVVGDLRHPTPMVQSRLDAVIFNPPWNVPLSIAVEEMLPRLRRSPRYLADNDIVILDRRETDPFGRAIDWSTVPSDPFPFALQQQPGPKNPLGRIKFETPNRFDVYLHDTPVRSLFARMARTSSHGCVRVEQARQLADYVLSGPGTSWNSRTIDEAIATGHTQRVPVRRQLPVYVLYWTAFVDADGAVHFRHDVYGRDQRLATALAGDARIGKRAAERRAVGCAAGDQEARH
jgi:L,D-transpeptidase YcbB